MYQSMPGPSRCDGFEGPAGPPGGPTHPLPPPLGGESCLHATISAVHALGLQAALPLHSIFLFIIAACVLLKLLFCFCSSLPLASHMHIDRLFRTRQHCKHLSPDEVDTKSCHNDTYIKVTRMYDAGGAVIHKFVSHLDTSSMHIAEGDVHLHPSSGGSDTSHKPPLSPYCPSANPLLNSFSASFGVFAADRVQSSPCIMQTDHAELSESNRLRHEPMQEDEARVGLPTGSDMCLADTRAFLQVDSSCGFRDSSASDLAKPCHLVTESGMEGSRVTPVDAWYSGTQNAVSLEAESPGMTALDPQSSPHPSTNAESVLQQGADILSDCQRLDLPDMQVALASGQAMLVDEHMTCCSSKTSAVEAAAEAASLSGLTATSSPCCTFQLPTALSQGITSSPAPSGDIGSEGSARRKSFSPLESGPLSILPLVENALIGLPSVSCSTLAQLMVEQHASPSIQVKIVDCRWVVSLTAHAIGNLPDTGGFLKRSMLAFFEKCCCILCCTLAKQNAHAN